MIWVVIIIIVILLLVIVDREIYFYEATHLGPRVQSWFYNQWAKKYDEHKRESQLHDSEMLARPVMDTLKDVPHVFVLDFATGTGRFPSALLAESDFNGHILALDISEGMLAQAAQKLEAHTSHVTLVRKVELPLPFPDNSFDAVSCMEALEIMSDMETPLKELFRVLRPGGFFITSRATEESGRRAKVKSKDEFAHLLKASGFERIEIVKWWKWFDRVTARKPGQLTASNHRALTDVLQCPSCGKVALGKTEDGLKCQQCGKTIQIDGHGVVLL